MDMFSLSLAFRCFRSFVQAVISCFCDDFAAMFNRFVYNVNQTCIGAQAMCEMNLVLKISVLQKFCSHPLTRTTRQRTWLYLSRLRVVPVTFNTWLTVSLTVIAIKENLLINRLIQGKLIVKCLVV